MNNHGLPQKEVDSVIMDYVNQLIESTLRDDAHEVHRAIKLDYLNLIFHFEDGELNTSKNTSDTTAGSSMLGQKRDYHSALGSSSSNQTSSLTSSSSSSKNGWSNCACIHCGSKVAATRYASHLSKCMGLGRNSSRRATRRIAEVQRIEDFDEVEDSWNNSDSNSGFTVPASSSSSLCEYDKEKLGLSSNLTNLQTASGRPRRTVTMNSQSIYNGYGDSGGTSSFAQSNDGMDSPSVCEEDSEAEIDWTDDVK